MAMERLGHPRCCINDVQVTGIVRNNESSELCAKVCENIAMTKRIAWNRVFDLRDSIDSLLGQKNKDDLFLLFVK
jgi:hypothetical protein